MIPTTTRYMYQVGVYHAVENFVAKNNIVMNAVTLCSILAFLLVFFASGIIISIISVILDKLFHLPLLKQVNTMAGLFLGVLIGSFNFLMIASLIGIVLEMNVINDSAAVAESTVIFKAISEIDLVSFFVNMLNI